MSVPLLVREAPVAVQSASGSGARREVRHCGEAQTAPQAQMVMIIARAVRELQLSSALGACDQLIYWPRLLSSCCQPQQLSALHSHDRRWPPGRPPRVLSHLQPCWPPQMVSVEPGPLREETIPLRSAWKSSPARYCYYCTFERLKNLLSCCCWSRPRSSGIFERLEETHLGAE